MKEIRIQDFVPYRDSLKWKIQGNYFRKKGAQAWLGGEVPYDITCNSCAAGQNAALVFEAVKNIERAGGLQAGEPVNVVEFASGVGLFAINFIRQFRAVCDRKNADYADRLVYHFTDFSRENLRDAAGNGVLRKLMDDGLLKFAVADACNPAGMRDALTGESLAGVRFAAAVANYLHCVLPLTILRKQDGGLYEKYIALSMEADPDDRVPADPGELFEDPTREALWPRIREEAEYRPIDVYSFFKDMDHFKVIEDMVKYYDLATVIYPYGSFEAVRNFLPMMKRGAIYVISDKGYADFYYMEGARDCLPSLHGNSFAHSVNFPLIAEYAGLLGLNAYRTHDPDYSLQTLVAELPAVDSAGLQKRFRELFVRENPNQDAGDFINAAMDYEKGKDYAKSILFLKKALSKRPEDAKIHYRLGNNCYDAGYFGRALDHYSQGLKYDHFNQYDFDFCIGQARFCQGQYAEAIPHYEKSIAQKKDDPKYAYVNIGLCKNRLERFDEAEEAFKKALESDPDYARAKECLERNQKRILL